MIDQIHIKLRLEFNYKGVNYEKKADIAMSNLHKAIKTIEEVTLKTLEIEALKSGDEELFLEINEPARLLKERSLEKYEILLKNIKAVYGIKS